MRFPTITGIIRRRILINYRVDPSAIAPLLPAGLRPKHYKGWAIAGICMIRLEKIRPGFLPLPFGLSSENAAHRIAVTWTGDDGTERDGVFIPRRDSNSLLNQWAGGRLFPGQHHSARFDVVDRDGSLEFSMRSNDGSVAIRFSVRESATFSRGSTFSTLAEASEFFRDGQDGFSSRDDAERLDGVQLRIKDWQVTPLDVDFVESSFFDERTRFPADGVHFDCALLMRNVVHEWRALPSLCPDCDLACPTPVPSGLAGAV